MSLRVLVADDNPVNQKLITGLLKAMGHTGIVVRDGEKAMQVMAQTTIDLVFLDDTMPVMDGREVLSLLRERRQQGRRVPPVIMVTANDLPGDRERYLSYGADGYLSKPVDAERLEAEVSRVLGR